MSYSDMSLIKRSNTASVSKYLKDILATDVNKKHSHDEAAI